MPRYPIGTLRGSLTSTMNQLCVERRKCGDLEAANTNLKADLSKTQKTMQGVFRKLLQTSDNAAIMHDSVAELGEILLLQEPRILDLRQELNGMGAQVRALRNENTSLQQPLPDTELARQYRRLEKNHAIVQRRLLTADARNTDLLQQNSETARKLQLADQEAKASEELTKAKADIEWYEGQTLEQQERIFDIQCQLGQSKAANRDLRAAHRLKIQRLTDECNARIDAWDQDFEDHLIEIQGEINVSHRDQAVKLEEHVAKAVAAARLRFKIDEEERIHEAVAERIMKAQAITLSDLKARDKEWKGRLAEVKKQNQALTDELAEIRAFMDEQVEEPVTQRLSTQCVPEQTALVQVLEDTITSLEAVRAKDQQDYEERIMAAIAEGWQMSSDEKFKEMLDDRNRMEKAMEQAKMERDEVVDCLQNAETEADEALQELALMRELAGLKVDEAEEQKEEIVQLKEELQGL